MVEAFAGGGGGSLRLTGDGPRAGLGGGHRDGAVAVYADPRQLLAELDASPLAALLD